MKTEVKTEGCLYTFSRSSFGELNAKHSYKKGIKRDIILTLVADDHPHLLSGVEADLNKDPRIKIVGEANSYRELLSKATILKPEIVLMDLKMPGYEEVELKKFFAKLKQIGSKIIIFSNETGWARIHKCLEIGAQAYIEKAISIGRLPDFLHRVSNGEELLIYTAEKLPEINFSPRQDEILHHLADGKENHEIARLVKIELKTVQSYVNEVKAKFAEAFKVHPIKPRMLILLASKMGFGTTIL